MSASNNTPPRAPSEGSLGSEAFVQINFFSAFVHQMADLIGMGSRARSASEMAQSSIRQAIDALAGQGFPKEALVGAAFQINAGGALGRAVQTIAGALDWSSKERLCGARVDAETGERAGVYLTRSTLGVGALVPASLGVTTITTESEEEKTIERLGKIGLREGSLEAVFAKGRLGPQTGAFIVGHELGHYIAARSGLLERLRAFALANVSSLGGAPLAKSALLAAEELYADAVGAMACAPTPFRDAAAIVDQWRCDPANKGHAAYLSELDERLGVTNRVAELALDKESACPELLAQCFWTALRSLAQNEARVLAKLAEKKLAPALMDALRPLDSSPRPG